MDGENVREGFHEMHLGAEKGKWQYPFPQVCDTNIVSGLCRQSGITGHRLCEAVAFSMK